MAFPTTTPIPLNTFRVATKELVSTAAQKQTSSLELLDFGINNNIFNLQDKWVFLQGGDKSFHYLWFNVANSGFDPNPAIFRDISTTAYEVPINATGSVSQVNTEIAAAINSIAQFNSFVEEGTVIIENLNEGDTLLPQTSLIEAVGVEINLIQDGVDALNPTQYNTIYTAPPGVSSIILMCQIANNMSEPIEASIRVIVQEQPYLEIPNPFTKAKTGLLIKDHPIPPNDAFNPLTGRLVLTEGGQFQIKVLSTTLDPVDANVTLSILENAIE